VPTCTCCETAKSGQKLRRTNHSVARLGMEIDGPSTGKIWGRAGPRLSIPSLVGMWEWIVRYIIVAAQIYAGQMQNSDLFSTAITQDAYRNFVVAVQCRII